MYGHTLDYQARDGQERGVLMNRGWWLHNTPRLIPLCRLLGHRPVVDGYGPHERGLDPRRWVACDRCGLRPDPKGVLDPEQWAIGQRYTGPFVAEKEPYVLTTELVRRSMDRMLTGHFPPGPWPRRPTGTVGGQVLLGRTWGVFSIGLDLCPEGHDHTLRLHAQINPLFFISIHLDYHGRWLTRRLLPRGAFDGREIGLSLSEWSLRWSLWRREGHWSRDQPKWWGGSINLDLVERLLGPKRYSYTDEAGPEFGWVALPEGDSYQVKLTLQRRRLGRPRSRRVQEAWSVSWESDRGIPTRSDGKRNGVWGSSVTVSDAAVRRGLWVTDALALIGKDLSGLRERYGYRPEGAEA
ncbi:hypothetical protein AB0C10_15895 [Microbispora amethystogenes]|uniref:hypothetical protein n=1 Tax=Microbispora amethystogenes TaxID=1427754 RepID=UPI0033EAA75B